MTGQTDNLKTRVFLPSNDEIQLTLTLTMTTTKVVEMLVTVNNSPNQEHVPLTQVRGLFKVFIVRFCMVEAPFSITFFKSSH